MQETQETRIQPLGREDPLEKEMATHARIPARIILDRGAWWATVHRVAKSWTWLSNWAWTQARFLFYIVPQKHWESVQFSRSVVSDSLWPHARQASLSIINSQSVLKLISIELVMPSNHLILCPPLLLLPSIFPIIRVFPMSQFFPSGGQSIGVLVSASVLPMNVQDWFPLGLTGWISLQSKGLSRVFSNTTVQKHQFFSAQLTLWYNPHVHTWPLENP